MRQNTESRVVPALHALRLLEVILGSELRIIKVASIGWLCILPASWQARFTAIPAIVSVGGA
jgi:hypothetical protein